MAYPQGRTLLCTKEEAAAAAAAAAAGTPVPTAVPVTTAAAAGSGATTPGAVAAATSKSATKKKGAAGKAANVTATVGGQANNVTASVSGLDAAAISTGGRRLMSETALDLSVPSKGRTLLCGDKNAATTAVPAGEATPGAVPTETKTGTTASATSKPAGKKKGAAKPSNVTATASVGGKDGSTQAIGTAGRRLLEHGGNPFGILEGGKTGQHLFES
eukprot:jgi/Botrbrau1/7858/Bobra.9_2s0034.1